MKNTKNLFLTLIYLGFATFSGSYAMEIDHMLTTPNQYSMLKFLPADIRTYLNTWVKTDNKEHSLVERLFAAIKTNSYELNYLVAKLMEPGIFDAIDLVKDTELRSENLKKLSKKIINDEQAHKNAIELEGKLPKELNARLSFESKFNKKIKWRQRSTPALLFALRNNHHFLLEEIVTELGQPINASIPLDENGKFCPFISPYFSYMSGYSVTPPDKATYAATPLVIATQFGHIESVQELLKLSANINAIDSKGKTALHWAAHFGKEEILNFLLSQPNIDLEAQDNQNQTALWYATDNGHLSIMQILLTKNANENCVDQNGNTPLFVAAEHGDIKSAQLLLDKCASIEHKNSQNQTPFLEAAFWGRLEMMKFLISKGAQQNTIDKNGDSALTLAASNGQTAAVKFLFEQGLGINHKNAEGNTPLMELVQEAPNFKDETEKHDIPRYIACAEFLLKNGANINEENNNGDTALILAIKEDANEIAKLLIAHGANVDYQNHSGHTALYYATKKLNAEMTITLFDAGAKAVTLDEIHKMFPAPAPSPTPVLLPISTTGSSLGNFRSSVTSWIQNNHRKIIWIAACGGLYLFGSSQIGHKMVRNTLINPANFIAKHSKATLLSASAAAWTTFKGWMG